MLESRNLKSYEESTYFLPFFLSIIYLILYHLPRPTAIKIYDKPSNILFVSSTIKLLVSVSIH